jgi:hypothetical protein
MSCPTIDLHPKGQTYGQKNYYLVDVKERSGLVNKLF